MVTLGNINYLNCIPIHGAILEKLIPFKGRLIDGTPAYLNSLLEQGRLTVSPSSSFELTKGYRILRGLSISSDSEVKSIILLTKKPLPDIKRGRFFVTSHSKTSAMLIRVIMREFYQSEIDYQSFNPSENSVERLLAEGDGVLYIGDDALKIVSQPYIIQNDLGKIWNSFTGLPFTFALWQVSKTEQNKEHIKYIHNCLRESYNFFLHHRELMAERFSKKMGFDRDFILKYWDYLSYELTEKHIISLKLFFQFLKKHKIINAEPEIAFFE